MICKMGTHAVSQRHAFVKCYGKKITCACFASNSIMNRSQNSESGLCACLCRRVCVSTGRMDLQWKFQHAEHSTREGMILGPKFTLDFCKNNGLNITIIKNKNQYL